MTLHHFNRGAAGNTGGYQISRSLRFNSADSAYLDRTPASSGNRRTWTWSGWVKKTVVGDGRYPLLFGAQNTTRDFLRFNGEALQFVLNNGTSGNLATTAVYRDVSAWYHIVLAVDTTQATDTNRVKIYVNGVQVTAFSTTTYPVQNYDTFVNMNVAQRLGNDAGFSDGYYNGYMTEIYMVDGTQLTPSSFGETNAQTGVWQPKAYSGSYGTNGFYLNFSDNSNTTAATLGKDYSGNGNNWTPNNFSVTAGAGNDSLVDSPTSYGTDTGVGGTVRGNYCTWNPLDKNSSISTLNGNLDAYVASGSWFSVRATFGMSSGKWYWECTPNSSSALLIGIGTSQATLANYVGGDAFGWSYFNSNGNKFNNNASTAYGSSYTTNDVIGIAFDADAGTLTFYKNGTSQGTAYTGLTSGPYFPMVGIGGTLTVATNFGQRPFAYTAPSGFKALCTQNLPTPTIGATTATQAGKYFNTVTYTGNGSSRSITGLGFQPSFTWIKDRSAGFYHRLADAVRGVGKELYSNDTGAETTNSANGYVTSFDSDGFSLGTGIGVNQNATTYVAWNWKANGSGSTNTAGSITSTVSANTTSGFSVVTFTSPASGTFTVGHGLGTTPAMVILKMRSTTGNWYVWHQSLSSSTTSFLNLNSTDGVNNSYTMWPSGFSSTTFSANVGFSAIANATEVAYCFAEVAGYSKFGSYTGNGSADGPFVYCGFRPAYVMFKRTDVANDWVINDATRSAYNQTINVLYANDSAAENTTGAGNSIDILSNGFKLRQTNNGSNASGGTYIFMAFASAPQKFALAR